MAGNDEVMRAVLSPMRGIHPRAAATLLEGLSLWYQQTVSVVLSADVEECSFGTGILDDLGCGERTAHYIVDVAFHDHRPPGRRLRGLGDFRDLRQLSLERGAR